MNRSYSTFIIILIVVIVAVGFNRGWFTLSNNTDPVSHKLDIKLDIDGDKAKADAAKVLHMTEQPSEKAVEKVKEMGAPATGSQSQPK